MKKIGFIGCGHLAKSLISGLEKSSEYQISGYDILEANLNWLNERGHAAIGLEECLDNSDILFLCVKPQDMPELCSSIADRIKDVYQSGYSHLGEHFLTLFLVHSLHSYEYEDATGPLSFLVL